MREDNTTTTTTATSSSNSYTLRTGCFSSTCKYRLPCGVCDRTGSFCTDFSYPTLPWYPPLTWTCNTTQAEGTTGSVKSAIAK